MFSGLRAAEDRLSDLLKRQAAIVTSEHVTLSDMADGDRSIAGLLLILALPMALPVPIPGISVLFGVPLIVISAQFALGYRRAWLPARLAQRSVSRAAFLAIVDPYAAAVAAARAHSAAACRVAGRPLDEGAGWHHLPGAGNHHHPTRALGSCDAGNCHLRPRARAY